MEERFALLIDADNVSAKYIKPILDELSKYGNVTYKRIYGDWTRPNSAGWKEELLQNSITPIQQFSYTYGKNATDSAMIIDAMDMLYASELEGFCLVSSDSDFTRLASRLRESGMDVIGMGESKTPRSFRAACSVFTDLELLREQAHEDEPDSKPVKKTERSNIIKQSKIENAIIEIIQENDNKGRQTGLGELGSRLQKKYSDFDVRNYGYSSLSTFLEEMESLELKKFNNTVLVRLKEDKNMKEQVMEYAVNYVKSSENAVELGALGQKIHMNYPNFKVKEYGYSTLSKFIASIKCLKITATDENRRMVSIK